MGKVEWVVKQHLQLSIVLVILSFSNRDLTYVYELDNQLCKISVVVNKLRSYFFYIIQ